MSEKHEINEYGGKPKTLRAYVLGFSFCLFLTILSFAIVQWKWFTGNSLYWILSALALIQFLAQTICFLGLNTTSEGRSNLLPFLFTLFIIIILTGGSFWIMYNLNYNMH